MVAPPPDFSVFTREQQLKMLFAGDPQAVRATAAQWSDIATAFYSRVADLERQLRDFQRFWSGGAATRYQMMIRSLIEGLTTTADVARLTADRIYSAAEALESMQAWVTRNMGSGPALTLVLTRLARRYHNLAFAIPTPPQAATPPAATEVLSGTYLAQAVPQTPKLFEGLYRNGIESASAALGGRFEQAVPALAPPGPATESTPVLATVNGTPVVEEKPPPVPETPVVDKPAVGRASVDVPSFGPVASSIPPVPVTPSSPALPNPSLSPNPNPNVSPMIPPMIPPMMGAMGGMGGGDLAGGGRGPDQKWLQESHSDLVFGVPLKYLKWGVIGAPEKEDAPPTEDSWGFA